MCALPPASENSTQPFQPMKTGMLLFLDWELLASWRPGLAKKLTGSRFLTGAIVGVDGRRRRC